MKSEIEIQTQLNDLIKKLAKNEEYLKRAVDSHSHENVIERAEWDIESIKARIEIINWVLEPSKPS